MSVSTLGNHVVGCCCNECEARRALPSAMERALREGEYNTIGEELRKLAKINELILDRLKVLSAQGSVNCERIDYLVMDNKAAWLVVKERKEHAARIEAQLATMLEALKCISLQVQAIDNDLVAKRRPQPKYRKGKRPARKNGNA